MNGTKLRILDVKGNKALAIDCNCTSVPYWTPTGELENWQKTSLLLPYREFSPKDREEMHKRFTLISGILPYIGDKEMRMRKIHEAEAESGINRQSIKKYLFRYLAYQDIEALAPAPKRDKRDLTQDEKNMRWALSRFFYTKNRNSLHTAYTMMLKERYCNPSGTLLPEHPSFYQFRYFYRKNRNMQKYYIQREGLKKYERDYRPFVGGSVQDYAGTVGVGMLDSTICDIYLSDDAGNVIGRPILVACVDAYSSLCLGYSLSWEGGTYSLQGLMQNIIAEKKEHCRKFGIMLPDGAWPCNGLPAKLITDMGKEYISETFSQITELGVTLVSLPPYRPELKGPVEKFFDLIQGSYKPYLKGKGVIEPDFQERGSHDYRKDACLTLNDFEKIILHCIVYYNSQRILEYFPYTEEMLAGNITPYACSVWDYMVGQGRANLIQTTRQQMALTLMPRAKGRFTQYGLKANGMRYHNPNYTERYLKGGEVSVAYNPDNTTEVWTIENGIYTAFRLIEARFEGLGLDRAESLKDGQRRLVRVHREASVQGSIDLARHIQAVADNKGKNVKNTKNIRENRKKEQEKTHVDYMGVAVNE